MSRIDQIKKELSAFRSLTRALLAAGLPAERAELWSRAAIARQRRALRRGVNANFLMKPSAAERYARLDALGCSPRKWI